MRFSRENSLKTSSNSNGKKFGWIKQEFRDGNSSDKTRIVSIVWSLFSKVEMRYGAVFQGGGGGRVGRLRTGGCLAVVGIGVAADLEPVIDEVAESVVWNNGGVISGKK
ncbi:hypothetical protein U1Q18_030781 [Sarracenia purpurea var. burkii]